MRACLRRNRPGPYQIQAAINAVHSSAGDAASTDWAQIVALYDQLLAVSPSPVVALHRAVAVAEVAGPAAALELVDGAGPSAATTCSTPCAPICCGGWAGRRKPRRSTKSPLLPRATSASGLFSVPDATHSPSRGSFPDLGPEGCQNCQWSNVCSGCERGVRVRRRCDADGGAAGAAPCRPVRRCGGAAGPLHELLPADMLSDGDLAFEIGGADRVEAIVAAYKAERIAQLAARRSAAADPGPETPGATVERDERLDPEVSGVLPRRAGADPELLTHGRHRCVRYVDHAGAPTPRDLAALADGELDWPRARAIAGELGWKARDTPPSVVAAVEAAVLPEARSLSVSGLRAAVSRELLARDSLAADARRAQAERAADVEARPLPDGMGELRVTGPWPVIAAMRGTVDGYAHLAKDTGDPRPLGQLRVGVFADLTLRPWDPTRPPVTAHLTVVAPIPALRPTATVGAEAAPTAELDGEPITAGALRALLEDLDGLCPGGLQTPTGGSLHVAVTDPRTGALGAVVSRRELRTARRPRLPHPPGRRLPPVLASATAGRPVPALAGAAPVHQHPRPHLPASRLPQPRRLGRPRPRPPTRRRRRHRLHQLVLPVQASPPAQDPRARLVVRRWTTTASSPSPPPPA